MMLGGGFGGAPATNSTILEIDLRNGNPAHGDYYVLLYTAYGIGGPNQWSSVGADGISENWLYLTTSNFDYLFLP
jgi:hypothetical protein